MTPAIDDVLSTLRLIGTQQIRSQLVQLAHQEQDRHKGCEGRLVAGSSVPGSNNQVIYYLGIEVLGERS